MSFEAPTSATSGLAGYDLSDNPKRDRYKRKAARHGAKLFECASQKTVDSVTGLTAMRKSDENDQQPEPLFSVKNGLKAGYYVASVFSKKLNRFNNRLQDSVSGVIHHVATGRKTPGGLRGAIKQGLRHGEIAEEHARHLKNSVHYNPGASLGRLAIHNRGLVAGSLITGNVVNSAINAGFSRKKEDQFAQSAPVEMRKNDQKLNKPSKAFGAQKPPRDVVDTVNNASDVGESVGGTAGEVVGTALFGRSGDQIGRVVGTLVGSDAGLHVGQARHGKQGS